MKRTVTLSKLVDFCGLNIAGITWDNVRTQLKKTLWSAEFLHIDCFQSMDESTLNLQTLHPTSFCLKNQQMFILVQKQNWETSFQLQQS